MKKSSSKTIPVFIDDIKALDGFDFSRCTYLMDKKKA